MAKDKTPRFFTDDPPPPESEADYGGPNVVPILGKKQPLWRSLLQTTKTGELLVNVINALNMLRNDPTLADLVKYDENARLVILANQIPGAIGSRPTPRVFEDVDVIAVQEKLQLLGLRRISRATVQDAIDQRAKECAFNPVNDYLFSLKWDGNERVEKLFPRYFNAENTPYNRAIGRMFLVSMIARQIEPGCQSDYIVILEGPQGCRKSSGCEALGGAWYSNNLPNLRHSDPVRVSMHLRGKWLIELGELGPIKDADRNALKEFVTQRVERFVPKFGRGEVVEPRSCVFIGTTNDFNYLKDSTGARRFWPVAVGNVEVEAILEDRDQLFAEAMHLYETHTPWWPDEEMESKFISPQQASRFEYDAWHDQIAAFLASPGALHRYLPQHLLSDPLGLPQSSRDNRALGRVKDILTVLGWKPKRDGQGRWWVRPISDSRWRNDTSVTEQSDEVSQWDP